MSSCSLRSSSGNNLPLLAQEGRSSPWPRLSQRSTISYSTLITFISSSSLSKSRSSVCHQGDVWHVLYVAFNCIDKPDKIVRLTGNWTEGGISLFEWSIQIKLAEVFIQILKSVCHWNEYKLKWLHWNDYFILDVRTCDGYSSALSCRALNPIRIRSLDSKYLWGRV